MKKHLVIKYFDTYPENKFYFDSKEKAEKFLGEKRKNNTGYLTTYEYRGIVEVEEWTYLKKQNKKTYLQLFVI